MELQLAEAVANAIDMEYMRASMKHLRLHSAYEGAAVLKEKYDILWEEVRRLDVEQMRTAAVRLAATALRFVVDTCPLTKTQDRGTGNSNRKPLDPRREKEIAAFERWQTAGQREAGRSSLELRREEHRPRNGQPDQNNVVCGARPKRPRCPAR
jgi:hypothetical protein